MSTTIIPRFTDEEIMALREEIIYPREELVNPSTWTSEPGL